MRARLTVVVFLLAAAGPAACSSSVAPASQAAPPPTAGPTSVTSAPTSVSAAPPASSGSARAFTANIKEVCAAVHKVNENHLGGYSPEGRARQKVMIDMFNGKEVDMNTQMAVQMAVMKALDRDLRPLAERATDPALRAAIIHLADDATRPNDNPGPIPAPDSGTAAVAALCPNPLTGL